MSFLDDIQVIVDFISSIVLHIMRAVGGKYGLYCLILIMNRFMINPVFRFGVQLNQSHGKKQCENNPVFRFGAPAQSLILDRKL
jgi:hypothetical protein